VRTLPLMSEELHPDVQRIKEACEALSEHFDTIHIFVTRLTDHETDNDQGTVNAQWGCGNWFARYGQIAAWIIKQDEGTRREVRDDG
jgi:hypothetical protein